jgi:hypothetical protein
MRLSAPFFALLAAASCNAISGVDDYRFVAPDASAAAGGGGQGGAGGQGGGGSCDASPDCEACQACANEDGCQAATIACAINVDCLALGACMADCQDFCASAPNPQTCISICISDCRSMYAGGADDYDTLLACYMVECPTTCF